MIGKNTIIRLRHYWGSEMSLNSFRDAEQKLIELIQSVKGAQSITAPYKYRGINDPLSQLLNFDIKEQELGGKYGLYVNNPPGKDKPLIAVDPNGSDEERLNFTYFHEVSHHMIRSDDELYEFLDKLAAKDNDLNVLKEHFADIGAAEFLLPSLEIKAIIEKNSFSIKLLLELDMKYPASKPAIAIQLARYATHKCFVVICEYGPIPYEIGEQSRISLPTETEGKVGNNYLHVRYAASSPSNKYSIGRYVIIPQNHILRKAFEEKNGFIRGKDNIPFRSGKQWPVACECIYYKGKVYAVFNVEQPLPPSDLQPKLL
jgi:hypothetical protein